ncbi:MAG: hypothetical protein J6W82_01200 [Bacteroidales bacterium]|nr:hypothetical protein [Bacteroidales bacterium]
MRRFVFAALLVPCLMALGSCTHETDGGRMVQVTLSAESTVANAAGDLPYDFTDAGEVLYVTDNHVFNGAVTMTREGAGRMSGTFEVAPGTDSKLWCYSVGKEVMRGDPNPAYAIPAELVKENASTSASFDGMVFCTNTIALSKKETSYTGTIKPITSAVVLEIMDSRGKQCGNKFTSVSVAAGGGVSLAGDIKLNLEGGRIGELSNTSSTLSFDCSAGGLTVGTADKPVSLGAVVLPCIFNGTVIVSGEGFKATFTVEGVTLQAGYVKHIKLDLADAVVEGEKHMPTRLAIMGDSISTFKGMIPSTHRTYYPTTNAACADVDKWEKTYWGHLINDYWHCELDVNSAWSGSCVAAGDPTVVRTPFVERCSLFKNPDVIILFGGTNDCQTERKIALGEFDYTSAPDKLNKYARFRESYIWVIKTLQANYPEAQIICIVGNHIEGEYGNSVKAIAEHMGIPYVDFRNDKQVTIYDQLHPNAAGHAHMAERIYNETLYLFQ